MHIHPSTALGRTWLATALFLAAVIGPGFAMAADDPSALLHARRADVTSAEVVMLSFDTLYRRRQTENDVLHRGCRYEIADRPSLDGLLDLLVGAEIVDDPAPLGDVDARSAIYLKVADKRLVKFVFELSMAGPAPGTDGTATPGGRVRANARLTADLRAWAVQRQPTSPCPH